jgi:hypothetical protein
MNNSRNIPVAAKDRSQLPNISRPAVHDPIMRRSAPTIHRAYFKTEILSTRGAIKPAPDMLKTDNVTINPAQSHTIIHQHLPVAKHPDHAEQKQDEYIDELIDDEQPLDRAEHRPRLQKPKKKMLYYLTVIPVMLLLIAVFIGYTIRNNSVASSKDSLPQTIKIGAEKYSMLLPDQVTFVDQKTLELDANDPGFYSPVTPKKVIAKSYQSQDKKLSLVLTNTLAGTDLINNVIKLNPANKDLSIEQYLANSFASRKTSFQPSLNNDEASKTELKKLNIGDAKILSLDSYTTDNITTEVVAFEGSTSSSTNPNTKLDIKGKLATYYYKKDSLNVMIITEKSTWDKKLLEIEKALKSLRPTQ